jgi:hypothetical protein
MYKANIWEYERGYGSKIDEVRSFDTKEERDEFVKKFNAQNTSETVPDWYMVAEAV